MTLIWMRTLGLSEAEIQKRLAEESERIGHDTQAEGSEEEEQDDGDDDEAPSVDANGKILFKRPKGSKLKGKTGSTTSTNDKTKKKSFEETLLAEAKAKANDLKRKTGSSTHSVSSPSIPSSSKSPTGDTNNNSGSSSDVKKTKKKQKTAKTTSLLSFDDEE